MNSLVVIPARGGSKGIPHKNIKLLKEKPLIEYTIDVARQLVSDANICVSTDDTEIINVVESYGLHVPFVRPEYLATDTVGTYDVLLHALDFYEHQGFSYDNIILLQTTSPFRKVGHVIEALNLYTSDIDMVVSVKRVSANPYYNCFEEDEKGYLYISKGDGHFVRRQDSPPAWEYNGAIYVINPNTLKKFSLSKFEKRIKYEMDEIHSLDLDTPLDWMIAELILERNIVK